MIELHIEIPANFSNTPRVGLVHLHVHLYSLQETLLFVLPVTATTPLTPTPAAVTTTQYQHSPLVSNHYQSHLGSLQATPPPPPPVLPTQAVAATVAPVTTFSRQGQQQTVLPSSSVLHTQASFLSQGGLSNTFGQANPMQVLQSGLPPSNRPQSATYGIQPLLSGGSGFAQQPLAYSTLNVSIASTTRAVAMTIPQLTNVRSLSTTSPVTGIKSLIPTNPSTGISGMGALASMTSYQLQAQLLQQQRAFTGATTYQQSALQAHQQAAVNLLEAKGNQSSVLGPPPAKRPALDQATPTLSAAAVASFRPGVLSQTHSLPGVGMTALPQTPPSSCPILPPSTVTPASLNRVPSIFSMTQGPPYLTTDALTPSVSTQSQLRSTQTPVSAIRPPTPGKSHPPQQTPQGYTSMGPGGTGTWGMR